MIRTFLIKDINYKIVVEPTTRKNILSYLDEYLENLEYDFLIRVTIVLLYFTWMVL